MNAFLRHRGYRFVQSSACRLQTLALLVLGMLLCSAAAHAANYSTPAGVTNNVTQQCFNASAFQLNITESFAVSDLDVGLTVNMTQRQQFLFQLRSPVQADGSQVITTLITGINDTSGRTNLDILLDDEAATAPVVNSAGHGNDNTAAPRFDRVVRPNNALSTFDGINPNGNWLFVYCDRNTSSGTQGVITAAELRFAAPPTTPDLSLSLSADRVNAPTGTDITFTAVVRNGGGAATTGTVARIDFPPGVSFQSSSGPEPFTVTGGVGTWNLGTVAAGATRTLTFVARLNGNGVVLAEIVSASGNDPDSTPGNGQNAEDDSDSVGLVVSNTTPSTPPTLTCDTKVGDASTPSNSLDWELPPGTFSWPSGVTTPRSYYQSATDGVPEVRISFAGQVSAFDAAGPDQTPVTSTEITGGETGTTAEGLHLAVDYATLAQAQNSPITVTFEFGEAIGGAGGANGSGGVVVPIYDVDLGGWTDRIDVVGSIRDGAGGTIQRTPEFTTSTTNFLEIRNGRIGVTGRDRNAANTTSDGNMWIKFEDSIDTLVITYGNVSTQADPAFQFISIGNISYCDPETPDLTAEKTVSTKTPDGFAIPGEAVVYTITASSGGDANLDATDVDINDVLPSNLQFVSATATGFTAGAFGSPALPSAGTDCANGACVVNYTGGRVPKGQAAFVTIEAIIK